MAKPDITCKITAMGPDGQAITDGGEAFTASGGAGAAITFVVKNTGTVSSGQFWAMPTVKVNGIPFYNVADQITLAAGQSKTYNFKKPFTVPTEDWVTSILADPTDIVDESNESNNNAKLRFTAHSVG